MPYKTEKMAIKNENLDKRVKLTKEDKQTIIEMYSTGNYSHMQLAKLYNVSKSLIGIVVNPNRAKRAKEQFKERQKDGRYYDKKKNREYMKAHRKYKNDLYKQGLIE